MTCPFSVVVFMNVVRSATYPWWCLKFSISSKILKTLPSGACRASKGSCSVGSHGDTVVLTTSCWTYATAGPIYYKKILLITSKPGIWKHYVNLQQIMKQDVSVKHLCPGVTVTLTLIFTWIMRQEFQPNWMFFHCFNIPLPLKILKVQKNFVLQPIYLHFYHKSENF